MKPNFPLLGKKFGPKMKEVAKSIQAWGKKEIASIESSGTHTVQLDGDSVSISLEEVIILSQDIPGWSVASDQGVTVALDVTVTDSLKHEGIARELVNRIQNLRKDMGLEVQDKINISMGCEDTMVIDAVNHFSDYIKTETQALNMKLNGKVDEGVPLDMDEYELTVKVEKA